MARGLTLSAGLTALIALALVHETLSASDHYCPPSSCGNIPNISFPFRLKSDPESCGDPRYELSCENNRTVLHLFAGKYYVQKINYNNYTIRVADSGIHDDNYFSTPSYSLYRYNFSNRYDRAYYGITGLLPKLTKLEPYDQFQPSGNPELSRIVVFMSCEKPVNSPYCLDTSTCIHNSSNYISHSKRYSYVKVGKTNAAEVADLCRVEKITQTSWPRNDGPNVSCKDVHNELVYGFEISWLRGNCQSICGRKFTKCYLNDTNHVQCSGKLNAFHVILISFCTKHGTFLCDAVDYSIISVDSIYLIMIHLAVKFLFGTPFVVAFLIYKWRRRNLSMYDAIEDFLQSHNNLMPIRYSYPEIRKMTNGFTEKLGEGGFATVFKGKLRSGHLVAIKMLDMSKANGQDFISEVATIGRIHHTNVVQLIGFCVEGPKRALIYEFMPNGSLNKYIFSQEGSIPLSIEKIYEISLGVGRGIEYLHQGCDMQILHFDIKPHNILLDENFTPKVSDFGLAKLYPPDDSIVFLTAARGTLGYMAPELFYKNIGGISYKADVYSFGMLLLEMASRRKNFNAFVDHSSQIYFPTWVYDQVCEENDIVMEDAIEGEKEKIKKMIKVALWCIQMKPIDRPSMNKVVEMLEGEVECSQMPSKPFLSSLGDVRDNLYPTCSSILSSESSQF
ncbi:LEAF RUST 10 DISEASE-RESISTANCE LOCUS RECEPTOR-LIKE PROTEIN KINASE-like 2.2 [Quercus robur]|uniref:LEAF RUST 10 DISEASE-RESISTANCE LOCUS RECEPTOR-LIKE PROTEIN KINASE-like 2.2 n=1 Tax=Quercus robur TaxID=38942 RepID=UPI002161FB64|nr:LEAF RUST 10 DISEASE-RESISTANCE LOCUS RECEPTOR-LIKE PROTEIN KINASE-like 2.2 [Quercus robur]